MDANASFLTLNCRQLRLELARRGAKTSGRKCELLQRLEDYDRNHDFCETPAIMPDDVLVDWPVTGFNQLTTDHVKNGLLPPITSAHIDGYFMHRMGLDRRSVGDAQALSKGKLLLQSNRIEACSILQENYEFYFSGICGAAMKKSLSYSLRVKTDQHGDILNSHCECPSGTGPHGTCKHVAALLLALVQLIEDQEMGRMNESCTDTLQSFHKPKNRYGGSPVKVEDLNGCANVDLADPRPVYLRMRANRQDRMRSLVINYAATTRKDITARYLFPGADLQAAALDHDYLGMSLTEHLVVRGIQLTREEAATLEKTTINQSSSSRWHEEREWRLTASRFGEICHMTERRNISKLCESILGKQEFHTAAITYGRINEPLAIKEFEKVSGKKVQRCGLFVDPEYPYLAATPDGLIDSDKVVEVKCPYNGRLSVVQAGKEFPFIANNDGQLTLKKSHHYYDQVQGQLVITKRKLCHFIVYTKVSLKIINVNYDNEYCQSSLLPKLRSFYDNHYIKFLAKRL